MMRAPELAAIQAAELRVAYSMSNTQERLHRLPVALRAALTRPATVMLAMGVAGALGFWLARRSKAGHSSDRSGEAAPAPTPNLLAIFLARFGMQYVIAVFRQAWVARGDGVARAGAAVPKSSTTTYYDTGLRE
jgi:hypothetical protein